MNISKILLVASAALLVAGCTRPKDGEYTLEVLSTNDVHGCFFDSSYVDNTIKRSLYAVKWTVDSVRAAAGPENVLLIDAGDILQGDNAAYYFDYVDTLTPHVYPRLAAYMGYDAVTMGNHDVETGHRVYDRVTRELAAAGIPMLGGNAIRTDNGKPYFPACRILRRGGLKIAVLGYTNANIKNWLAESLWSGMTFENLLPLVQQDVDAVRAKEKPHAVIVSVHSATGEGDGTVLESQGLDLLQSLQGVDLLLCSHDHRPFVKETEGCSLVNSGSHCRFVGHGTLHLTVRKGKVTERSSSAALIPVNAARVDTAMRSRFHDDYLAVKRFTNTEVGTLDTDLRTRDAYAGMSDYINLVHTLCISCAPAQVSIAAPLTFNGTVRAGTLVYNDLFTIYPFENQLYVLDMTGAEIVRYLEASYDRWIRTAAGPSDRVLNIVPSADARTGATRWSFAERSYNFDSAAGLVYTVDVTKPRGERVKVSSMASGAPFEADRTYKVAMTSYRANGGGGLLEETGIDTDRISERVAEYYPEIRNILYNYLKDNGSIQSSVTGDPARIGHWEFIPAAWAPAAIRRDLELVFGR